MGVNCYGSTYVSLIIPGLHLCLSSQEEVGGDMSLLVSLGATRSYSLPRHATSQPRASTWVTACHTSRLNMPISALCSHADSHISCFRKHQLKEVSHKRCLNASFFFFLCKAALTKHTHKHTEGFSVPWGNHLNLWSRPPCWWKPNIYYKTKREQEKAPIWGAWWDEKSEVSFSAGIARKK